MPPVVKLYSRVKRGLKRATLCLGKAEVVQVVTLFMV